MKYPYIKLHVSWSSYTQRVAQRLSRYGIAYVGIGTLIMGSNLFWPKCGNVTLIIGLLLIVLGIVSYVHHIQKL